MFILFSNFIREDQTSHEVSEEIQEEISETARGQTPPGDRSQQGDFQDDPKREILKTCGRQTVKGILRESGQTSLAR